MGDAQVAAFIPLIESLAGRYTRSADFDDLRQEGMIAVWLAFRRGQAPTVDIIENRMRNWSRRMTNQRRLDTDRYQEDALYEIGPSAEE